MDIAHAERTDKWTLILVHGTWGRGYFPHERGRGPPRWFEPGSNFRTDLTIALTASGLPAPDFVAHVWSGENSFFARELSALRLARMVNRRRRDFPSEKIALIGHSHGGNVLLRTLDHLGKIENTPPIISLATPFVELAADPLSELSDNSVFEFGLVLGAIAILAVSADFVDLDDLTFYIALGTITGLSMWWSSRNGIRMWNTRRRVDRLIRRSSHRALFEKSAPMLVIRGVDDEASLALASGAIAARLGHLVDQMAFPFFMCAAVVVCLIGSISIADMLGMDLLHSVNSITKPCYGLAKVAFGVGFAVIWLAQAISKIAPAVYGREVFLLPADVEINSHSAPDAPELVTIRTLRRNTNLDGRMRHGIYSEPACSELIAEWLATQGNG